MRAALYRKVGRASEVLSIEEIPTPQPSAGQVRVRITASGVNPTDWKTRSGATGADPDGFQVPHQDGAGVIDAVGAGVGERHVGERVWCYLAAFENRYGTAAQYCVLPPERTVALPAEASDELGASLGVPAVTAAHCLGGDPAALAGTTVLVAGGAGAVGHFAIELAKHAGARVVTTVSSPHKAELARAAGADLVVNYRDDDALDQIRRFCSHVERIVEVAFGANLALDVALSAPGTEIVVYAAEAEDPRVSVRQLMTANVRVHFVLLYRVPPVELAAAVRWVDDAVHLGALTALPVHRYRLGQVAAAQDAVANGALGKVIVLPN